MDWDGILHPLQERGTRSKNKNENKKKNVKKNEKNTFFLSKEQGTERGVERDVFNAPIKSIFNNKNNVSKRL